MGGREKGKGGERRDEGMGRRVEGALLVKGAQCELGIVEWDGPELLGSIKPNLRGDAR